MDRRPQRVCKSYHKQLTKLITNLNKFGNDHFHFMTTILNAIHLCVKHNSNTSAISTAGQTVMYFRSATTMIHIPRPPLQSTDCRVLSLFIVVHFHTLTVKCGSAVVTWEQLSDVWLDKRSQAHAVTTYWCLCRGPAAPCNGSAAHSLSGPLCCEWQWSRLPQEAEYHAGHTI